MIDHPMKIIAAFAIGSCAWAQSGIDRPQIGKMLDANGAVRTVYGIAASVTLGEVETTGVLSSACSKTFCLAKTETSIVSALGSVDAPAGPALFAFDGSAAYVWFSRSRELAQWQNGTLTSIGSLCASRSPLPACPLNVDGEVLSIEMNAGSIEFAVQRPSGVWIVKSDGSVVDSLPDATGPVMLIPGGAVYATSTEVAIRDLRIPLAGVTAFSRMSAGYVEVSAAGLEYSLRIEKGREMLFQLPGVQPVAASAQLAMYAVNGTTVTAVGSSYSFGQVALNATSSVEFQIYNTGSTAVSVNVTLSGTGFTWNSPLLPFSIPANSTVSQTLNINVNFTPSTTASYSANLQVGSLSVILVGSGVTAPTLTTGAGCSSQSPFNWGRVPVGTAASCTFALQNSNPQAVAVASVVVNGLGFTGPYGITAPLTLQPGQSISFSINFTPPGAIAYTGTVAIGTQSYALTGTGQTALLPTPSFQFDSGAPASGQQRVLTMTLASASPIAATGLVNLAFTPSTAAVKDDSEIVFLANGARSIPFSVSAGATTVLLSGQGSATFQTGTTEGTITFTMTTLAAMTGASPEATFVIPGAKVILDSTSASTETDGVLLITITGADNTYSAGAMSFSFFDTSGNAIGGAVNSDFTAAFKTYYGGQTAGSAFLAQVSFPVTGSIASIGSVTVTLTNAAGVATTGSLTFQ
jgi:hypothetical protein